MRETISLEYERTRHLFVLERLQDYIRALTERILHWQRTPLPEMSHADFVVQQLELKETRELQQLLDERPLYFGRIDVLFDESHEEPERIYIGKVGFQPYTGGEILIHDWRAPICQLYYQRGLGKVCYSCPDGRVNVEVLLRRTFAWSVDLEIVENQYNPERYVEQELAELQHLLMASHSDQFLHDILNRQTAGYLRDIVRTIAADQDAVIRHPSRRMLIIGAAGTGKTVVALHRIAYQLYEMRHSPIVSGEKRRTADVLLLSPSRLFACYVNSVLPSLYESPPRAVAFADLFIDAANELLEQTPDGKLYRVETPSSYQSRLLSSAFDALQGFVGSQIKNSLLWKDLVPEFIQRHAQQVTERLVLHIIEWVEQPNRGREASPGRLSSLIDAYKYVKNQGEGNGILEQTLRLIAQSYIYKRRHHDAADILKASDIFDFAAVLYAHANDKQSSLQCWAKSLEMREEHAIAAALYEQIGLNERAGDCYRQAGKIKDAIRIYRRTLDECPEPNKSLLTAIAQCYEADGDYRRAELFYEKVGEPAAVKRCRAQWYIAHGNGELAALYFQEMSWFSSAAECHEAAGNYVAAACLYYRGGRVFDSFRCRARYYSRTAQYKHAQGDQSSWERYSDKAAQCYERAQQYSEAALIYRQIAQYKHAQGDQSSQKEYLRKAEQCGKPAEPRKPNVPSISEGANVPTSPSSHTISQHLRRAREAEQKNSFSEAARHYELAGDIPKAAQCYEKGGYLTYAASCYERLGDLKRAAELYKRAQQYAEAGICYERAGDYGLAKDCFQRAHDWLSMYRCLIKEEQYDDFFKNVTLREHSVSELSPNGILGLLKRVTSERVTSDKETNGRIRNLFLALYEQCYFEWNPLSLFRQFWLDDEIRQQLRERIGEGYTTLETSVHNSLRWLDQEKLLPWEDVAPLLYIASMVFPVSQLPKELGHPTCIVIDEAQDLSPLHYECLRPHLPSEAWVTVCGDFNQVLVPTASVEPHEIASILGVEHVSSFTYTYRSTAEIMSFAHNILARSLGVQPVRHSSNLPCVVGFPNKEAMDAYVQALARKLRSDYSSVCVICRTDEEADRIAEEAGGQVTRLALDSETQLVGAFVATIGTVKGLEFDAVIIYNCSADNYNAQIPLHRNHLYVACTRALHCLHIVYAERRSPLLPKVGCREHSVDDTAECYEQVGMHAHAACFYEQKSRYAQAAEQYEQAGDKKSAARCWAKQAEQQGQTLKAAQWYEQAEMYADAGRCYKQAGRYADAGRCYKQAGRYADAGRCYEQAGDTESAARCWAKQAGEGQTLKVAQWYEQAGRYAVAGRCYKQAGRYADAGRCYEQAEMYADAGRCYEQAGRYADAGRCYEQAGRYADAGSCYKQAGRYADAGRCYEQAGRYADAGRCYEQAGRYADAGRCYEQAEMYADAGRCCEQTGDKKSAARCWAKQAEQQGQTLKAAQWYEQAGRYADAGWCYKQAGRYADAGSCYEQAGRYADAGRCYEQAEMYADAGWCYKQAGRYADAGRCYEQAGRYADAGRCYEQAGDKKSAARCWAKQAEQEGQTLKAAQWYEQAEMYADAGWRYEQAGSYTDAGRCYEWAGSYADAGRCYEKAGNYGDAARCLKEAGSYSEAGRCYMVTGEYAHAAVCYMYARQYMEAAACYEKVSRFWDAGFCYEQVPDYIKAAACYEQANRLADAARCYELAGDKQSALRCQTIGRKEPAG